MPNLIKIHTDEAPQAIGPYSQAVIHNGVLYTSGQIALNPETGTVVAGEIEEQTKQVLKNLSALLKEAGTTPEAVIKTTCFLKDMADFARFNGVYETLFHHKPARSCVAVRELPKDVLVEIEVIAAIDAK